MANIYEKMSAITQEITAVAKNLNVGEGKNSYKGVGESAVLAAVRPVEAKFGVYSYPLEREIVENAILTSQKTYNGQTYETRQQFIRVRTVYRFVNTDDPKEYIDITTYGDGVDPQDKAPGKAMTYADKYALLKAYKIVTGEDPDQYMSRELKSKEEKTPMVSDKQIDLLKRMGMESKEAMDYIKARVKAWDQLTMKEASAIIGDLKDGKHLQNN